MTTALRGQNGMLNKMVEVKTPSQTHADGIRYVLVQREKQAGRERER